MIKQRLHVRRALPLLAALGLAMAPTLSGAIAQTAKPYEPKEYQDGKDVIWVPTPQALVDKMLDMAKVTASR